MSLLSRDATTPERYRRWMLAVAVLVVLLTVIGTVAATASSNATARLRDNTGPVLVATQTLRASLAEADAAATAAYLTLPDEDRVQRRAYEDAIARATAQLEEVSALIGDDDATHAALKDVAVLVTRYAGLVEAARAARAAELPQGDDYLVDAVELLDGELATAVTDLTDATSRRLDSDAEGQARGTLAAVAVGVLALAVLAAVQVRLAARTRRVLNPGLVPATVAVLAVTIWLGTGVLAATGRFDAAVADGYRSIEATAAVQEAGFSARAAETVALVTGDRRARDRADAEAALLDADDGLLATVDVLADSDRERQLTTESRVRWGRYEATVAELRTATDPERQLAVAVGPLSADFNGFVFAVEGVLADNRDQFLAGLEDAAGALRWLPLAMIVLPLLAGAMALAGLQARVTEYR